MNKAIHQLTYTQDRDDVNDRFYMVRSATDYQLPGTALPPKLYVASRLLTDTQVLALFTTPIEVVPAAPVGWIYLPMRGLIQFVAGGTVDYATNTDIVIRTTTGSATSQTLVGDLSDRTDDNLMVPTPTGAPAPTFEGDGLSVAVLTGNPTAGDSDIRVTVWYQLQEL